MTSIYYWNFAKTSLPLDFVLLMTHALRTKNTQLLIAKTMFREAMTTFTGSMLFVVDIIWFGMVLSLALAIGGCGLCERNVLKRKCLTDNIVILVGICGFTTIYILFEAVKMLAHRKKYRQLPTKTPIIYHTPERAPITRGARLSVFVMMAHEILSCIFIFGMIKNNIK